VGANAQAPRLSFRLSNHADGCPLESGYVLLALHGELRWCWRSALITELSLFARSPVVPQPLRRLFRVQIPATSCSAALRAVCSTGRLNSFLYRLCWLGRRAVFTTLLVNFLSGTGLSYREGRHLYWRWGAQHREFLQVQFPE
jgi:hypothetical protein